MKYRYSFRQLLLVFAIVIPSISNAQTGWQWAATDATPAPGIAEASIVNLDSAGNIYSAQAAIGQAYFAFGADTVHDPGLFTIAIISKTDPSGHNLWAVGTDSTDAMILAMATDKHGNSYAFGEYDSSRFIMGGMRATNPLHNKTYFLAKVSTSGSVMWAINVLASGPSTSTAPSTGSVRVDDSGNVYVCGTFKAATATIGSYTFTNHDATAATEDIFLAKYNPSGSLVWAKSFGGSSFDAGKITVSGAGNVYMSVYSGSDTVHFDGMYVSLKNGLVKTDRSGTVLFANGIPVHGLANLLYYALTVDAAENVYLTGYKITTQQHLRLTKFDQYGNLRWDDSSVAASIGGGDLAFGVAADECGNVWVCGGIGDYCKLGTDTLRVIPSSSDCMFLARFDTGGAYISNMVLPIGGDDEMGIAVDNRGSFYLGGDFMIWPGGYVMGPDTLTAVTSEERWFVAKYQYDTVSCLPPLNVHTTQQATDITLYPNPAQSTITIASASPITGVVITNIWGQVVARQSCTGNKAEINISSLPPAVYLVRINASEVRRFVKE